MADQVLPDLRILIPVRPVEEGKSRLASRLPPHQRAALNQRFFDHVAALCCDFVAPAQVIVVSRSAALRQQALAMKMQALEEAGSGLNQALEQGARLAAEQGAGPLLALATDLPDLARDDLVALVEVGRKADIAIAPDLAGEGTNALLMARPGLIPYHYGLQSLQAHRRLAADAGLSVCLVERPGLARDVDTPADLGKLVPLDAP